MKGIAFEALLTGFLSTLYFHIRIRQGPSLEAGAPSFLRYLVFAALFEFGSCGLRAAAGPRCALELWPVAAPASAEVTVSSVCGRRSLLVPGLQTMG